jgi:hypothetical protein
MLRIRRALMAHDDDNLATFLMTVVPHFIRAGIITEPMADSLVNITELLGEEWRTPTTVAAIDDAVAHPRSTQAALVAFHALKGRVADVQTAELP